MSTLLIMAGGTGGHVYPALAVAEHLRARQVNVVWLGTRAGLEARVVPARGIEMEWVAIRGLRGHGLGRWLIMPAMLLRAMVQTARIIRRRRPDALLGMGGFVAGPGALVGRLLGRPLVIHEQNAVAGTTNRWLARLASRVLTGFPNPAGLPGASEYVGNPVRDDIGAVPAPAERLAGRDGPLRLLVVGGSQGARVLNETLPAALARFAAAERPLIRHQSGRDRATAVAADYRQHGVDATVEEFIDDMAAAYAWSDLVVCRAGAMTIAELAAAGAAAILVPFPQAVDDHQTVNARFLADRDAALLVPQSDCTPQRLYALLAEFAADRPRLKAMAERAHGLARPDASERVASRCLEVMRA